MAGLESINPKFQGFGPLVRLRIMLTSSPALDSKTIRASRVYIRFDSKCRRKMQRGFRVSGEW